MNISQSFTPSHLPFPSSQGSIQLTSGTIRNAHINTLIKVFIQKIQRKKVK